MPLALGSAIRPPPDLLGLCAAVDEKAAALLGARDQAMLAATATLQVALRHLSLDCSTAEYGVGCV